MYKRLLSLIIWCLDLKFPQILESLHECTNTANSHIPTHTYTHTHNLVTLNFTDEIVLTIDIAFLLNTFSWSRKECLSL